MTAEMVKSRRVRVVVDHHILFVRGVRTISPANPTLHVEELATDQATNSGRRIGECGGLIALYAPRQIAPAAPMLVEVWDREPTGARLMWDYAAEFPLPCREGNVYFQGAGGHDVIPVAVPKGVYRARICWRFYGATGGASDGEEYRLSLWPSTQSGVTVRKQWEGRPTTTVGASGS
jgi:hypothetical protein